MGPSMTPVHRCRARPPRPDRRQHAVLRNGAIAATVFPRLPAIKDSLGLTNAELGVAVAALPVGGLLAGGLAGALIVRARERARRRLSGRGRGVHAGRDRARDLVGHAVRRLPRVRHVRRDDGRGDERPRPRRPARLRALDPPAVPRAVERRRHGGRGCRRDHRGPRDRGRALSRSSWPSCWAPRVLAAYRLLLPAAVADVHPATDGVAEEPVHLRHAGRLLRVLVPIAMLGILCIDPPERRVDLGRGLPHRRARHGGRDRRRRRSSCSSRRWPSGG